MPAEQQHIDKDFIDDSWDQMSAMLDREMPTNPKPSPPGKSWLTAILLLLFAWTTYLYWPHSDLQDIKVIEEKNSAGDQNPVEILSAPIATNYLENDIDLTSAKLVSSSVEDKSTPNSKGIDRSSTSSQIFDNHQQTLLPTNQNEKSSIVTNLGSNENLMVEEISRKKNLSISQVVETRNLEIVEMLSRKSSGVLAGAPIPKIDLIVSEDNGPKWTIAANAEMIFDRRLLSGKYLGLQVKRKLNDQFSLLAGVGLSEFQKLNPAENSFEGFAGMPVRYDYDDDKLSIIGINALSYLTVPVELVFDVREKWSVIVGAGFSYMVKASFNNGIDNNTWQSHADGSLVTSENELLGKALQRFDIAPSIGFTFRPTRRIGLDLKFRNGILDISKNKFLGFNEFHSNRFLHLGMSYDLVKF